MKPQDYYSIRGKLWILGFLALTISCQAAPAVAVSPMSKLSRPLLGRQDDTDIWNFDWISKWAAIGDSYAAGIGAGKLIDNEGCSRYDQSYPSQMESDDGLGDSLDRTFAFLACSGAVSNDVITKQLPKVEDGQDVITLSAGGNDVNLIRILNQCVYQFPTILELCETALAETEKEIDTVLPGNLDALLEATKKKLSPEGSIFVTGYARFFGTGTMQCDNISWSIFPRPNKVYLTQDHRNAMNRLVLKANTQLKEAVNRAGPQVVFVDYDWYFELIQGRFCEDHITETASNRQGLLFYNWETVDEQPNEPGRKREYQVGEGSFEATIENWIQETINEHPDWEIQPPPQIASPISFDERSLFNISNIEESTKMLGSRLKKRSIIPDGIRRVFHPRPAGHHVIASLVLYKIAQRRAEALSLPLDLFQAMSWIYTLS
jgi:lysophospholipase L1-like esterase